MVCPLNKEIQTQKEECNHTIHTILFTTNYNSYKKAKSTQCRIVRESAFFHLYKNNGLINLPPLKQRIYQCLALK